MEKDCIHSLLVEHKTVLGDVSPSEGYHDAVAQPTTLCSARSYISWVYGGVDWDVVGKRGKRFPM